MAVDCKKCIHNECELICRGCIHWYKLTDKYQPQTYHHLCPICGMVWDDEIPEDPEYCPQCHNKFNGDK